MGHSTREREQDQVYWRGDPHGTVAVPLKPQSLCALASWETVYYFPQLGSVLVVLQVIAAAVISAQANQSQLRKRFEVLVEGLISAHPVLNFLKQLYLGSQLRNQLMSKSVSFLSFISVLIIFKSTTIY